MRTIKLRQQRGKRAFTLMEVVMALAVVGTMGAGAYVGFNSLNTYAISSRLYSEAQTAAQNQIDLILSKEPFDPTKNKIPKLYNSDATLFLSLDPGTYTKPSVFVYQDPVSGSAVVTGIMTTTITDGGTSMTFAGSTTNLNTRCATVAVTYTYRGKTYNVSMDTMRTGDQ